MRLSVCSKRRAECLSVCRVPRELPPPPAAAHEVSVYILFNMDMMNAAVPLRKQRAPFAWQLPEAPLDANALVPHCRDAVVRGRRIFLSPRQPAVELPRRLFCGRRLRSRARRVRRGGGRREGKRQARMRGRLGGQWRCRDAARCLSAHRPCCSPRQAVWTPCFRLAPTNGPFWTSHKRRRAGSVTSSASATSMH